MAVLIACMAVATACMVPLTADMGGTCACSLIWVVAVLLLPAIPAALKTPKLNPFWMFFAQVLRIGVGIRLDPEQL